MKIKIKQQPRFVYDNPIGEDHFEGKSQEKVADNIISFIRENNEIKKRVIGIDGEWGSGKSNLIKIIEKKTTSDFSFFTFDTWGHQEDLTRRTFLEELVDDLVDKKLLDNAWKNKLNEKLATNRITITKNIPELNNVIVAVGVAILSTPLFKILSEYFLIKYNSSYPGLWSTVLTFIFVILVFLLSYILNKDKENLTIGKLLYLYKGEQIKTTKHETITSLEPTVREFRNILAEIVDSIDKKKQLIFVFDNLDRLPVKKVKEIWSSVHTFFSEDNKLTSLNNWVLIPYDQSHICKVFSDDNNNDRAITVDYIQKTFSIVFRISPPILSDWKKYFDELFSQAFNYSPPPQEQLANLFDYLHNDITIKPRQIIDYVNNLVALNKQWGDLIPLRYCGLFYLSKSIIIEDPVKSIIERSFVKKVESIFAGDNELEKYISALFFNVELEKADEVLLRRSIEKALRGESNYAEISSHPAFITVLDSCFYNTEINIEKTIESFDELNAKIKTNKSFEKYWKQLTIRFIGTKLVFPESEILYKILFRNLTNTVLITKLLNLVLYSIEHFSIEGVKVFKGGKYSEKIDDLNNYLISNDIDIDIFTHIQEQVFEPNDFIEFVNTCSEDYKRYKIKCDVTELNNFLIATLPKSIDIHSKFIQITISEYDYSLLRVKVEKEIKALTTDKTDYLSIVNSLINIYQIIADDKPFSAKIPTNQAWAIFVANPSHSKSIDLLFSVLSDSTQINTYINHQKTVAILNNIEFTDYSASIIENYIDYGSLLQITSENPYPLLISVVKTLTKDSVNPSKLDIGNTISIYNDIKTNIIKDDDEFLVSFLNNLDGWFEHYCEFLDNIEEIDLISLELLGDCTKVSNRFTEETLKRVNDYVINSKKDDWVNAFTNSESSYLFQVTCFLVMIKRNTFTKLSESALESYLESIFKFIEQQKFPSDVDDWDLILDLFDRKKLSLPLKEIRDKFIYSPETISQEAMYFFNKGLFAHGGLNENDKVEDVIRKIIYPSINDEKNFNRVILKNKEDVVKIIKKSKEHYEVIVETLISKLDEKNKTEIEYFAEKLGFSINNEDKNENETLDS
jgi:hypothetical protein